MVKGSSALVEALGAVAIAAIRAILAVKRNLLLLLKLLLAIARYPEQNP